MIVMDGIDSNGFECVTQVVGDVDIAQSLEWKAEWRCWQTGIELQYLGTTLLRIKEVTQRVGVSPFDYRSFRYPFLDDFIRLETKSCRILPLI